MDFNLNRRANPQSSVLDYNNIEISRLFDFIKTNQLAK